MPAHAEALSRAVAEARNALASRGADAEGGERGAMAAAEAALRDARSAQEEASRSLGRAEGELSALRAQATEPHSVSQAVPALAVRACLDDIHADVARALGSDDAEAVKDALQRVIDRIERFRQETGSVPPAQPSESDAERAVIDRVASLTKAFEAAREREAGCARAVALLRERETAGREAHHAAERDLIAKSAEEREVQQRLAQIDAQLGQNAQLRERFDEEVREGIALIGGSPLSFESAEIPEGALSEDRSLQEGRRRDIERLKIKIEEYRGSNKDEVMKEYAETHERDQFLAREIADLERSAASLYAIIEELEQEIDERFRNGLSLIRTEFHAFFTQLFGGGNATLELERAREADPEGGEDAQPAGLAVSVQLPKKQMRGLEVLSGGERALTSIALIFAMSQVNPPPFLILDETDAALDEANSRRYAEIVKTLAKKSQLILITHNRATMAAAGELYGVTMGQDGVSKLLSVKLEEAQQVAK